MSTLKIKEEFIMIIGHNLMASNAIRNANANSTAASKSMAKLASGNAITTAADDAAGLSISEKMKGQIRGLDKASSNAQDGVSLVQTADGALSETTSVLQRMRELAVQSANDTNTSADRDAIQTESDQLAKQIDNIANTTQFNTQNLLTGNLGLKTNDSTNVTKLSMTADTKVGTLNLTASATMATDAKATLTLSAGKTTAQNNGTLDIVANGKTYNVGFTNGQSVSDIATQITNTVTGYTAAFDATTGALSLTSNVANADQSISIQEETADSLDGATSFTAATTATGTNASGLAGTGSDGLAAAFTYSGNEVTVTSGSQKGLTFTLQADAGTTSVASTVGKSVTSGAGLQLQIGANQGQTMTMNINAMDASSLGVSALDVSTQNGAENAISSIDKATAAVSSQRATLGAYQNRLESTINNLSTTSENLTSAESSITDVDMAKEMSNYSKNNILSQAAQAMISQANQQPQQVLQLLR
jgi:flagellin